MNSIQEIDAKIKSLWSSLNPDQIAQEMGLKRGTVMRRAKAIGLPPPPKPEPKPRAPKKPKVFVGQKKVEDGEAVKAPPPVADRPKLAPESYAIPFRPAHPGAASLADRSDGCRFPLGESPVNDMSQQLFCCETKQEGSSYCWRHHNLVWRPAPQCVK